MGLQPRPLAPSSSTGSDRLQHYHVLEHAGGGPVSDDVLNVLSNPVTGEPRIEYDKERGFVCRCAQKAGSVVGEAYWQYFADEWDLLESQLRSMPCGGKCRTDAATHPTTS